MRTLRHPWLTAAVLLAVVTAIALVALAEAASPWTAETQGRITSTDIAIHTATGQVFTAIQIGERVEVVRTDDNGAEQRRWWVRPGGVSSGVTSDIAVSPRTEETIAAMARDHLIVKRFDREGDRTDMWETGFTETATDLAVQELTREMYVALVAEKVSTVMLGNDGVLADVLDTGLTGARAAVALTDRRHLYVGVAQPGLDDRAGTGARFDGAGELAGTWPLDEAPVGVAAGAFDDVYYVTRTDEPHAGSVYRFMDDGRLVSEWQLGAAPTDVAVDADGLVYVTTLHAGDRMLRVSKYSPSGDLRARWMALARVYLPFTERPQ